jgi:hypothetical protein
MNSTNSSDARRDDGPINFASKLAAFSDPWSPKVVAELNDYQFKLVKLQGTCHVLLVEPRGVVNTGAAGQYLTADNDVWI